MNDKHLIGLMSATCLALMAGLMWLANATPGAFALVGFWPKSTFLVGATLSFGRRKYAEAGNKKWRWRDSDVALVASLEENRSNIGFFDYQKTNLSVVIE